jgi:hypothetical protein
MRPAEDVAREMVPDPDPGLVEWRQRVEDDEDYVPLEVQDGKDDARAIVDAARGIIARLIERSRAEGAANERERLRAVYGEFGDAKAVVDALAEDL